MERPWGRMTSAFELMRATDSRLPAVQVDAAFRGKLSIAFRSPDGAKRLGKNLWRVEGDDVRFVA